MSNFPAGSKIIVTKPDQGETYKKGDIFTVANTNTNGGCGVYVTHKDAIYYVSNREFEAYSELKFKVGDKVVVQANPEWAEEGQAGVIERVDLEDTDLPYDVKGDAGWSFWMREQDLELVKEYTFADIQQGDTIRVEYTQDDVKYTHEGVAAEEKYNGWVSGEGHWIAAPHYQNPVYTLLERPEPPKPNPFAKAEVGSLAWEADGYTWYKTAENAWCFLRHVTPALLHEAAPYTDERMNDGTFQITYNAK